ncbi:hypothetical protein KUC74_20030 [Pseudomonas aeruginosa]|uniref:hypothetical protein n=1 Tax=Pseudomonas aeruginosa TaxID=287 RepID=UPI0021E1A27B|nr:hypothetical protein [Pseudomonas aeruginosa]MCV0073265.1 hypothetical protein [Pseudomonas aeruginosa]
MSREFHEGIGQYTEGNINNYGIQINLTDKAEERGLVPAQRKELHELRAKCEELGDDPRDVWRRVHAQLGVKSISEIASDQFPEARDVLRARLEQLQDETDKRRLVGKVLRAASEKDASQEVNNFCELTFGRTQLTQLKRAELQKVLEYILQFEAKSLPPQQIDTPPQRLPLREFLITYKANAFWLFVFGIIVDRFWIGF